jgi:CHASE2 domain-containing sensor protein
MRRFWLNNLIITIFVFFLMWGASKLFSLKLFDAFDPIGQALSDFEMTDYAFSKLRPDPKVEERIVLVNIGKLSRIEIAQQLSIISSYKPRVIGIDSFFNCEGGLYDTLNCPQLLDTLSNVFLSSAIEQAGNVVMVTKLLQTDSLIGTGDVDLYDSIEYSDPMFTQFATPGFASLPTDANYQEDVKLCRSFFPKVKVNGVDQYAFSVAMAMKYDSTKTAKLFKRNRVEELVNFRGNFEIQEVRVQDSNKSDVESSGFTGMFSALDISQVMNEEFDSTFLKDKIVIMGYMGDYFGDPSWDDKFFTPLNKKVAGRANPDMFGPLVHANIVAMILNEDYIEEISEETQYAIAFISCLLIVSLFVIIDEKLPSWFDALSVIIQVILILLTSGLVVYAFAFWGVKLDLSITLAATAFVGPSYDIFKSAENSIRKRLTIPKKPVFKG